MELRINPEFRELIHPLSEIEFKQLEKNILGEGIRDPLCVWEGTLIDGHHRYQIAQKHNLAFETKELPLNSADDVELWMINNQLGKRNLTPDQFNYFIGLKYEQEKKSHGGDRKSNDHFDHLITAEKIAEEHNISAPTVRRAGALVSKLIKEKSNPELSDAFANKQVSLSTARQVLSQPKEKQNPILEKILSGECKNVTKAKRIVEQEERIQSAPKVGSLSALIRQGDCLEMVKSMEALADVVITDPPYGIDVHNTRSGLKDYADGMNYIIRLLDDLCAELVSKTKPDAHLYFFCGYSNLDLFKAIISKNFDVQDNPIIWVKDNHTMCDFSQWYPNKHEYILFAKQKDSKRKLANCKPDVLTYKRERSSTHSAEKPTELLELLIEQSTLPGQVVLDPFMGSGSTGVAAKNTGRQFVGFEMDAKWVDVARSRIA